MDKKTTTSAAQNYRTQAAKPLSGQDKPAAAPQRYRQPPHRPVTKTEVREKTEIPEQNYAFPLGRMNFIIMAVAVLMIVIGFILISGGASENGEFNPEIFSAARIVIGPALAFLGFIAMGVGIMWGGREKNPAGADAEESH